MQPRDPPGPASPPRPDLAQLATLRQALILADDERELLTALAQHLGPGDPSLADADPRDPLAALARFWPADTDDPRRALVTTLVHVTLDRLRDRRARDHALAAAHTLHTTLADLHAAADPQALLDVLARHAARHGATAAWLLSSGDAGPRVLARWGDASTQADPDLTDLTDLATTTPHFFADLVTTRHPAAIAAAVVLPLSRSGHADGHVLLAWPAPHDFTPDERQHYPALAQQAAVVVANHRLLTAARDALREQQRQRATLTAILDDLPVSVVVQAAHDDEPLLMNRSAEQLRRDLARGQLVYPGSDTPMSPATWPLARALQLEQVVIGEAELRAPDGTRRSLESLAAPVHDERGALTHAISVTTEVTAWRVAEAERLAMQDDLIHAQQAALAERSTPLLPISDDILVLPIIGSIDDDRGHQLTETLVELGGSRRVRVAILDLTGAGALDPRGAQILVSAARALRLRGVQPILTGLHPDAATSLAAAGFDLTGIRVHGSLQAGIAHARTLTHRAGPRRRPVPTDI